MASIFCHKHSTKNAVDELLLQKEVLGMKVHIYFKVFLLLYLLMTEFLLPVSIEVKVSMTLLYAGILLIDAFFHHQLSHKKSIKAIGVASLVVDVFLISHLPFIWYHSVGGLEAISPVFLLKTSMPYLAIGFIAINAFAIQPLYPLVMSFAAFAVNGFLYFYVLSVAPEVFTNDLALGTVGPEVNPVLYWITSFSFLLFGVGMSYLAWMFRQSLSEAVNLEKANTQMGRYFSPEVAGRIASAEKDFLKPGGRRQKVAVMFIDIRNFTAMSESLAPEEVTSFLSDYHNRIVKVIFKHGGTLDKFMGDGIMATFGTPEPVNDDLSRALEAGLEIKKAVRDFNDERAAKGLEPIGQGIGLHFGEAIVGNIGTEDRLEYTVIGDTVNVASRLESACKETGADFIISSYVQTQLKEGHFATSLGQVQLKGKAETQELFAMQST